MIKTNAMVKLKINNDHWIGEVVEVREETALIHLMDNMHYHAKLEELELLQPNEQIKAQEERKNRIK